jgi:hypothetical protein
VDAVIMSFACLISATSVLGVQAYWTVFRPTSSPILRYSNQGSTTQVPLTRRDRAHAPMQNRLSLMSYQALGKKTIGVSCRRGYGEMLYGRQAA